MSDAPQGAEGAGSDQDPVPSADTFSTGEPEGSVDDAAAPRGYRLVGDCDFASCQPACAAISPVPGGVGPMTRAMLLVNTLEAASRAAAR